MPGMNEMASMGGGFATAGADVSNMMGQTEIADGSGLVNANMNIASGLANAATGLASNGITFGANMAEKGVEERFKMGNNAVGSIGNIMGATADYINQASGKVSSKDSPVADQMSAKIQNSSNLQIDEFLEDSSNDDENTILQAQTVF